MSLRFLAGAVDGLYKIRAVAAGYDARTAPIDGILFDSDMVPMVAHSGEINVPPGDGTGGSGGMIGSQTYTHGLGYQPLVAAIARVTSGDPWTYWRVQFGTGPAPGVPLSQNLGNTFMDGRWCGPYTFVGSTGTAANDLLVGGWAPTIDATALTIKNSNTRQITVRYILFGI